ncbi:hypothetical protein [Deinococcus sp.]|uniref:hypothetical protein n=1 Tax=Deinococcus sp. TaxID=47478 RepID=UPI003CC504E3
MKPLSRLPLLACLLALGNAAALPMTLTTLSGVTTLSGTVAGWTLGQRTVAFLDGSPARVLTSGTIDARGRFRVTLPTPAQLVGLTARAGDRYDVVGCDDQPSDYNVSGREVELYDLPALKVLKPIASKAAAGRASYEARSLQNLTSAGEVTLMYASDYAAVAVNVTCPSFGSMRTVVFDLKLAPGWNAVFSRAGRDTYIENAAPGLSSRWVYSAR